MKTIMAIDLGKFKSVVCNYTAPSSEYCFETIETSPRVFHDYFITHDCDVIVVEVCSIVGWICDLAEMLEIEIKVANTNDDRWSWRRTKRKTDRVDALKLAKIEAMNELPLVHIPEKKVRQKRELINFRQQLSQRVTQIKNSIRSILDRQALSLASGQSGWTKKSLEQLRRWSRPMQKGRVDQLWRGMLAIELENLDQALTSLKAVEEKLDALNAKDKNVMLLQTAGGVGPRTAEAVAAFIDDPGRFKNCKQVGCYVGYTPRQYQSGTMDRYGRISKDGNGLLRSLLVEACWVGMRYNPWIKQTYENIRRGSKTRKKIAIVATARRLLVRLWAMMRDGTVWQMPELESAA